jgi:formamidopyrimidine-DNA glycosylase
MPELPDVVVYVERLAALLGGATLQAARIRSPALLRTADPPLSSLFGRKLIGVERIGKRIVFAFEDERFLVLHLMIAGRLKMKPAGAELGSKITSAAFDFDRASLQLTEAGTHKRAQLHVVAGREALRAIDRGGIEVLHCTLAEFDAALRRENHTLKRTLTDPRLLSGIGNAYSDEILHRARISPIKFTNKLDGDEVARLFDACKTVLVEWTDRLREQTGEGFPEHVTAFRPEMAVHGRAGEPCPVCGTKVQRIVYAKNETNYCPTCQTGGQLLADRALSRLLKKDWPRTLTELEERMERLKAAGRSGRGETSG